MAGQQTLNLYVVVRLHLGQHNPGEKPGFFLSFLSPFSDDLSKNTP
jgi:hypothetical protein